MSAFDPNNRPTLRPFPLADLERRTDDCMAQIRAEARRIADETKAEILALRRTAEAELNEREAQLAREQEELDRKNQEFNEREAAFQNAAFEEARRLGFDEGKREGEALGYNEGLKTAQSEQSALIGEESERRLAELADRFLPTLETLTRNLGDLRQSLLAHWETNILQIAAAVAHQAIGRELSAMPDLPLDLLREALELAVGCTAVRIRMNPNDLETLRPRVEAMLSGFGHLTSTELVPDSKMLPGGCIVESSLGTIDQRLESRLERIIAELSK